jgi:hypothetical protein
MTFNTYILNNSAASSYAGNGTSGVLFWGAMINVGTTANTYVQTVASAVVNNWTANNFSVNPGTTYDSMVDVPGIAAVASQNDVGGVTRGNYATLNSIYASNGSSYTNGNLQATTDGSSGVQELRSTIEIPTSGKWYCEMHLSDFCTSPSGTARATYGVHTSAAGQSLGLSFRTESSASGSLTSAAIVKDGVIQTSVTVPSINDVLGFAIDSDAGSIQIFRQGSSIYSGSYSFISGNLFIGVSGDSSGEGGAPRSTTTIFNFGQRAFTYTPPAGFKSLCTTNLPNPIIKRPSDHFNVKTWTGNGNSQTIGTTNKQTSSYQISRSLRFRDSVLPHLTRTPTSNGSPVKSTFSAWIKTTGAHTLSESQVLFAAGTAVGFQATLYITTNRQLSVYVADNSIVRNNITTVTNIPNNTWTHITWIYDDSSALPNTERSRLYINGARAQISSSPTYPPGNAGYVLNSTSYPNAIGKSAFQSSSYYTGYMAEVNYVDGNALEPSNFGQYDANNNWVPTRYAGTYGTNGFYLPFSDNSSLDTLGFDRSSSSAELITNGSFPTNVSGWTVGAAVSGSPSITWVTGAARIANSANNGVMYYQAIPTTIGTTYYASCNVYNISIGGSSRIVALQKSDNTSNNSNLVTLATRTQADGNGSLRGTFTATATTTYIFINADILGTGTQGADFDNISVSEVAYKNNWSLNNFSTTAGITYDSMLDSPTDYDDGSGNIRGNYPIFNTNTAFSGHNSSFALAGGPTFTNAGTRVSRTQNDNRAFSTLSMSSGKWYWEFLIEGHTRTSLGINLASIQTISPSAGDEYGSPGMHGLVFEGSAQYAFSNKVGSANSITAVSYADGNWAVGNTIGIAFDADNGELYFSRNGVWGNSGNPATRTNPLLRNIPQGEYVALWAGGGDYPSSATVQGTINFGQRPFTYTPPAGYKSLNTKTLKEVGAFNLPDTFGNYVNTPDLIWIKNRSNTYNHILQDTVRGTGLYSDITATAQSTVTTGVQAFLPNGFQIGSIAGGNLANDSIVGWTWNRGQIPGFDIVNYAGDGVAGRKVPHNLGVPPKFIIAKNLSSSVNWMVGHNSVGWTHKIEGLNTTTGSAASSLVWNNTAPSSTDITLGSDFNINSLGYSFIAYIWAEVPGFSRFASYIGNGAAAGPYVYTGFRPRWVMIKRTDAVNDWIIYDTERQKFNTGTADATKFIRANTSAVEDTDPVIDAMASGFKVNGTTAFHNASGGTYVYAAFAESPFKYANAR